MSGLLLFAVCGSEICQAAVEKKNPFPPVSVRILLTTILQPINRGKQNTVRNSTTGDIMSASNENRSSASNSTLK